MRSIVKKYYIGEPNELTVLKGIDLDITEGEFTSIVGTSGSGKSTLMNIIGLLDRPTEGSYLLDGIDTMTMSDNQLSKIRNQKIGFVFQSFNLIPRISALANVELPMLYAKVPAKERRERAMELLKIVEMDNRASHNPNELSGGQQQRVAIARSIANNPQIILADEPTGALDTKTSRAVIDIFHRLNEEEGRTVIIVTHDTDLANEANRVIEIMDGEYV